jgi:hypothetical protein
MGNSVLSRTQIMAVKKESTEGTLEPLTSGADFIKIREGATQSSENEVIESDELVGSDIGKAKSIVVGENPSLTVPMYVNASGVEGQEPEEGAVYESSLGDKTVNTTEYDTVAGSTTSVINVDTGEGANFEEGQLLLIKDGTNGYSARHVDSISSDALTLNFNVSNAPASGVSLGKCVLYKPGIEHPTFSSYRFSSETSTAYRDAVAGNRTTSLTLTFPARDLATVDIEAEGIKYYFDYITIDATNEDIDFTDSSSTVVATLTNKVYTTPLELATEIATKMTAASVDTISCEYSSSTGKFTLSSDGTVLSLLWNSGTNTATSAGATIGFDVSADDTGSLSYLADNAISLEPPYSPSFDSSDPNVAVKNQLIIGDADEISCRKPTNTTLTVGTPKTQVLSACADNGVFKNLTLERTVEFSSTILLPAYEAELFDRSINNTDTKIQYTWGVKDNSGNWTAGKTCSFYMQAASITGITTEDQDGYRVINITARGFVDDSRKDIFLAFA